MQISEDILRQHHPES